MIEFWNERYSTKEFVYGIAPNAFLKDYIDSKQPARILFAAEGEGRNAIYAAKMGWDVFAFDQSDKAKEKAEQFARKQGVYVQYDVCDILDYNPKIKFDVIAFAYLHLPPEKRQKSHKHLLKYLKLGGELIFEAFSKAQIKHTSGGPKNVDMLYSIDEISHDFNSLKIIRLEKVSIELNESKLHNGTASVLQFVGKK